MLDRLLYRLVQTFFRLLGRLPLVWQTKGACVLGYLIHGLDRYHRRIALQNLTQAFGAEKTPAQIRCLARKVFTNLSRIIFEIGWAMHLDPSDLHKYFRLSGVANYQRAIAKGRGVLLLGAHFSNWELLPIVTHLARIPVRVIYRPMDAPFLDRFFKEHRSRFGAVLIPTHRGAMQKIYLSLRQGYSVGLLMDQGADWYDGVFVDFFNRRAATNIGMAVLALKSEAPVVPLFLIREPAGFHAEFGAELPLIRTGDRTKDIEENTQQYNRVIEAYARKYPDQWFWVHQRWKNRPYWPWPRQPGPPRKRRRRK